MLFQWTLDLLAFLLVVGFALGLLYLVERVRRRGATALAALASPLGLRLSRSGRRRIAIPEDFILHERFGAGADSCRLGYSLAGRGASALPAIFEYLTFRDVLKGQRLGYPVLVLAVGATPGAPEFRLRLRKLREWMFRPRDELRWSGMSLGRRWILRGTDSDTLRSRLDSRVLRTLARSGLWIQQTDSVLFLARTPRPWRPNRFDRHAVGGLLRAALPTLRALGHPDAESLERLLR